MRQEVYTKFAEALQRKQAEQHAAARHTEVVAKFAEALDGQMARKQAEQIYFEGFCKAAELAGADPEALVKEAAGFGRIARLMTRLQPKVNLRGWFDPRRLITTVRHNVIQRAENPVTGAAKAVGSAGGGASAYGNAGMPRWSDIANKGGVRNVARIDPLKVLAALLAGGGTAAAVSSSGSAGVPAPSAAGGSGHGLLKALGVLGGIGLAGGAAGAATRAATGGDKDKDEKKKDK